MSLDSKKDRHLASSISAPMNDPTNSSKGLASAKGGSSAAMSSLPHSSHHTRTTHTAASRRTDPGSKGPSISNIQELLEALSQRMSTVALAKGMATPSPKHPYWRSAASIFQAMLSCEPNISLEEANPKVWDKLLIEYRHAWCLAISDGCHVASFEELLADFDRPLQASGPRGSHTYGPTADIQHESPEHHGHAHGKIARPQIQESSGRPGSSRTIGGSTNSDATSRDASNAATNDADIANFAQHDALDGLERMFRKKTKAGAIKRPSLQSEGRKIPKESRISVESPELDEAPQKAA